MPKKIMRLYKRQLIADLIGHYCNQLTIHTLLAKQMIISPYLQLLFIGIAPSVELELQHCQRKFILCLLLFTELTKQTINDSRNL